MPKSNTRPSSKCKKKKIEIELTSDNMVEVLKTQKLLSRKVFDSELMPKPWDV